MITVQAFLSKEMQYSCPIWGDSEGGPRGDLEGHRRQGDLESAQRRKIETVLTRARLRPGDRLLEVGTGWGSIAIAVSMPLYWHGRGAYSRPRTGS